MAWEVTKVTEYVVADRRCHVYDCVIGSTWAGAMDLDAPTGATGPTLNDFGFADIDDPEMTVRAYEIPVGATGAFGNYRAWYSLDNQRLMVYATGAVDLSARVFRVEITGKYQL